MNKIVLQGEIGKINVRQGQDGKDVAQFVIHVARKYTQQQDAADYIRGLAFTAAADYIKSNVKEGDNIVLLGHLQTRDYTDNSGQKKYVTEAVAESVSLGAKGNYQNEAIFMGRLTRDPHLSYGQTPSARYTVAVDRRFGGDQTADFISCVAFQKKADFAEKYLRQGTKVLVDGHIQTGSYTNQNGEKVYTTDIVVDNTEFAESKNGGNNNGNNYQSNNTRNNAPQNQTTTDDTGFDDGFMNIPDGIDEFLPFS